MSGINHHSLLQISSQQRETCVSLAGLPLHCPPTPMSSTHFSACSYVAKISFGNVSYRFLSTIFLMFYRPSRTQKKRLTFFFSLWHYFVIMATFGNLRQYFIAVCISVNMFFSYLLGRFSPDLVQGCMMYPRGPH